MLCQFYPSNIFQKDCTRIVPIRNKVKNNFRMNDILLLHEIIKITMNNEVFNK